MPELESPVEVGKRLSEHAMSMGSSYGNLILRAQAMPSSPIRRMLVILAGVLLFLLGLGALFGIVFELIGLYGIVYVLFEVLSRVLGPFSE